jgi:alkanesulfonate monooxygenase SsuD/methylene tetrahydromethanopterin reductase-like flavin-dependent oxidoreductase (luciferase family)
MTTDDGLPIGLVSLGEALPEPHTGVTSSEAARLRQIVEYGVLADELGMRSFHVGEHHFGGYFLSSPTPVLAAIAERTSHVRLSTAVTLLPHHDPVRIAEDYATLDVLSGGRAEIIGGRGVDQSVYGQYGQDHAQSETLLVEAVELLRMLWTTEDVSWTGSLRPPLHGVTVRPRPVQPSLPLWLSASSCASAERAAVLGCPIVIPTVSTGVTLPVEIARTFRDGRRTPDLDASDAQVLLHVHCYVGEGSTEAAIETWRPYQLGYIHWVFSTLRPGTPLPEPLRELGTPIAQAVCGSADRVADELNARIDAMGGVDGLLIQFDHGGLGADLGERSLRRFMSDVAPALHTR